MREGDTLWSIAEKTTGDPLRYQEIFELNRAAVQPDGGRLDTPETWLEVGWTLRLPAGAAAAAPPGAVHASAGPAPVLVQPGDTLWSLAERIAPARDPREVVSQIRRLNGLPTAALQAGQQLLVPAVV